MCEDPNEIAVMLYLADDAVQVDTGAVQGRSSWLEAEAITEEGGVSPTRARPGGGHFHHIHCTQ